MPEPIQTTDLKFQTYSNKDYLNKIYIDKYELSIDALMNAILEIESSREEKKFPQAVREQLFKRSLASLYWSLVVPRIHIFDKTDEDLKAEDNFALIRFKEPFLSEKEVKMNDFERLTMKEGSDLLAAIASYLHSSGAVRTEKKEQDKAHGAMEEMEI